MTEKTATQPQADSATVIPIKHSNGKPVTVKSFFTAKLGVNIGERLYKEFVAFAEEATKHVPGEAAVVLDDKNGRIVSITAPN